MSYVLTAGLGWSSAYLIIGLIQAVLTFVLIISLPLWGKVNAATRAGTSTRPPKRKAVTPRRRDVAGPTSPSRTRCGFPAWP